MAAPNVVTPGEEECRFSTFLSLPLEIRHQIYHDVFWQRGIVLGTKQGKSRNGQRPNYYIKGVAHEGDGTISLLQLCKQVLVEAQPLLSSHQPSHFVLGDEFRIQPVDMVLSKIGIPWEHLTRLTVSVRSPEKRTEKPRMCYKVAQRKRKLAQSIGCFAGITNPHGYRPWRPRPYKIGPGLCSIHELKALVRELSQSFHELHIHNVLGYNSHTFLDPCRCPIAGTERCICGDCRCTCTDASSLSHLETLVAITESRFQALLLSKYRAKLPHADIERFLAPMAETVGDTQEQDDYDFLMSLLDRDVQIFLHDDVPAFTFIDDRYTLKKNFRHAVYHLSPTTNRLLPVEPEPEDIFAEICKPLIEFEAGIKLEPMARTQRRTDDRLMD